MSLSDFRIVTKIGQGAYSSVHKVRRLSDDKEYALKKVKLGMLKDKEKQNSLNEVRILASIDNPYIISYRDTFIDDNSLCMIMEYADGGDLEAKIKELQRKRINMEEKEVWKMIGHLLQGLSLLHDMKILHRDIKSANVFISNGNYKLGDLNVSKIVKNKLAYTQTGTPYYASPQVWRDEPYDSKSDIWSLGCVIYEVCSLRPPFQAKDMEGLYRRVQRGTFDRIPRIYSNQLQKFVQKCLQLSAQKRPSCRELLESPFISTFHSVQQDRSNSLLDTIRMPKNIKNLKQRLPKAKYDCDSVSERDRGLSRNSDGHNRYRTDSSGNYHLPSISKPNELKEVNRIVQSTADHSSKKTPQSQLMLLKPTEKSENRLKDIQREKQKIQDMLQLKKKEMVEYSRGNPYGEKRQLSRLLPLYVQQKPEEYSRPAWWG